MERAESRLKHQDDEDNLSYSLQPPNRTRRTTTTTTIRRITTSNADSTMKQPSKEHYAETSDNDQSGSDLANSLQDRAYAKAASYESTKKSRRYYAETNDNSQSGSDLADSLQDRAYAKAASYQSAKKSRRYYAESNDNSQSGSDLADSLQDRAYAKAATYQATKKSAGATKSSQKMAAAKSEDPELGKVPPTHPPVRSTGIHVSQPGAVAVTGSRVSNQIDNGESLRSVNHPTSTSENPGDIHLISATLVDENPEENAASKLPYVEATKLEEQAPESKRKLYIMLGAIAVLLVIGIVVGVSVGVTRDKGGGIDAEPENLANITVVLQMDEFPEQTGWSIVCGTRVVNNIPVTAYGGRAPNDRLNILTAVGLDETCDFTIVDSAGNGITNGFYQLFAGQDTSNRQALLVEGSGDFGASETVTFQGVLPPNRYLR